MVQTSVRAKSLIVGQSVRPYSFGRFGLKMRGTNIQISRSHHTPNAEYPSLYPYLLKPGFRNMCRGAGEFLTGRERQLKVFAAVHRVPQKISQHSSS